MGEGRPLSRQCFRTLQQAGARRSEHSHNRHSCRSNSNTGKFFSKASRFLPRLPTDYHLAQGSVWIRQHLAPVWSIPAWKDATMATAQGRERHCTSRAGAGLSKCHLTATDCKLINCHLTTDYKCDLLESSMLSSSVFFSEKLLDYNEDLLHISAARYFSF